MSEKMQSFLIRLRSSIILIIPVFLCMYFGGVALWCLLLAVSLVGLFEFYRALKLKDAVFWGYLGAVLLMAAAPFGMTWLGLALAAGLLLLLGAYVLSYPKFSPGEVFAAAFGLLYIPYMLSHIYCLRAMTAGRTLVWLVLITAWGSDVFAYLSGMLFGKHKLTPVLSPKKSVEGAVGAVICTALLTWVYGLCTRTALEAALGPNIIAWLPLIGALGSAVSQIGDLTASAIKRAENIKDYGNLIPGHGGIMDRFDSVIFTAPVICFLVQILAAR